jgi:signal transduction histidine kinase
MILRGRSLQVQIAVRLGAVILLATLVGVGVIVYEGSQAADTLGNEVLLGRAKELARHVTRSDAGEAHLELPSYLDQIYQAPAETDLFLIQADTGQTVAASKPDVVAAIGEFPTADIIPRSFRIEQFGPNQLDYYGLRVLTDSAIGPLSVTVARASDADALAYALLRAFVTEVAWIIPLVAAATLAVGVWSIRRGLRPMLEVSERAAEIAPDAITVRLPVENLPNEVRPLVEAINRALDRLEEGFATQRQFTANAAHELRTPLAILTAGLDELESDVRIERLRGDAARMNRLVGQLLCVARLDAMPLNTTTTLNLSAAVEEVVAYLAPWAVARGRSLGFDAPDNTVWLRGNGDAIADAVRNLIENAVYHAPVGTEVAVSVSPRGAVSVSDSGPGVPAADRQFVFARFWRGHGERGPGAGLGLAIVAEIAKAHNATIEIADADGGGALFLLRFPVAEPFVGQSAFKPGPRLRG